MERQSPHWHSCCHSLCTNSVEEVLQNVLQWDAHLQPEQSYEVICAVNVLQNTRNDYNQRIMQHIMEIAELTRQGRTELNELYSNVSNFTALREQKVFQHLSDSGTLYLYV